jgi:alkylation response protein AidB-like acyl-CoA dehydrogenase
MLYDLWCIEQYAQMLLLHLLGKAISTFQNTRFKLAELRTEIDFCRTYLDRCMELQLEES